jgi:hypothetical protein
MFFDIIFQAWPIVLSANQLTRFTHAKMASKLLIMMHVNDFRAY